MTRFRPMIAALQGVLLLGVGMQCRGVPPGEEGPVISENRVPDAAGETSASVPPEMLLIPLPEQAPAPRDDLSSPARIALGRLLFFDPILSATKDVACATCHHPAHGWADGRATPLGIGATGFGPARALNRTVDLTSLRRNSPSLLNVAFNGLVAGTNVVPANAPMFWDARVRGLEAQALVPLQSRPEMLGEQLPPSSALDAVVTRLSDIPQYLRLFQSAFPTHANPAITPDNIGRAIATFERTLTTGPTPFDRFLRGDTNALSALQQQGLRVFKSAGCIHCHGGPMLSDFKLHFIGVPDSGPDARVPLRTPTLRNLKHSAPYMHNGRLRALADVLLFYEQLMDTVSETLDGGDNSAQPPLDPLLRHLVLNPEDFPALEAFLDSLNAERYDTSAPDTVPSGLPVAGFDVP